MTFPVTQPTPSRPVVSGPAFAWDEERYQQWLCERQLPVVLRTLGFVAFAVVAFGAWDVWISKDIWISREAIVHTWPFRVLALVIVAACAALLRFTEAVRHWRLVSLASSCILFCLLLLILVRFPEGRGVSLGSGGLLLSAFLLRVHSPRLAVFAAIFNTLAVPVVFRIYGVNYFPIINSEIFLLIASIGNITLNFSDDESDRQKFALEWQLERMATTDGLTGACNRRSFAQRLDEEIERAQRYGNPLSIILLDIDHFKRVNDTRGHGDGDQALKALAAIGIESGRSSDMFARLGGEEFVMLLPHTTLDAGQAFAERLRVQIEGLTIRGESGIFNITSSFGVAALKRVDNGDAFLARADAALYLAKHRGRNRVVSQDELIPESALATSSR